MIIDIQTKGGGIRGSLDLKYRRLGDCFYLNEHRCDKIDRIAEKRFGFDFEKEKEFRDKYYPSIWMWTGVDTEEDCFELTNQKNKKKYKFYPFRVIDTLWRHALINGRLLKQKS